MAVTQHDSDEILRAARAAGNTARDRARAETRAGTAVGQAGSKGRVTDRAGTWATDRTTVLTGAFRTGTALRAARLVVATAAFTLAWLMGSGPETARTGAAELVTDRARPGAIGVERGTQRGPRPESFLPDRMQPVEISGPPGMLVSIETAAGWSSMQPAPLRMGLLVGSPYRLRIGGIEGHEGDELFPTVRVLAKLAAPPGMAWRFPVEVVIDDDDLRTALGGSLVRRIIYASCEPERPDILPGAWFDVRPGDDALEVARTLGDPVAEVVIGNRVPSRDALP
jgi:hypothetical protein